MRGFHFTRFDPNADGTLDEATMQVALGLRAEVGIQLMAVA